MVVDDEPDAVAMQIEWLALNGFDACGTSTALHAIELAVSQRPDVILTDVNMPFVDGLTIVRTLKEHTLTAQTPVVLLTGDARALERCREQGIETAAVLQKPCRPDVIVDTLRAALAVRAASAQRGVEPVAG
jgi:two-component system, cell cycle response regulator DivK